MQSYPASILVQAARMASQGDKSMASGILNAMLGSCCIDDQDDDDTGARQACALMRAYDAQTDFIVPDVVALSLAYLATHAHDKFHGQAGTFLSRAETIHGGTIGDEACLNGNVVDPNNPPNWLVLKDKYDIGLLQESDEFLVLCKPSGMACYHVESPTQQSSKRKRRRKEQDPSLEQCLLKHGVLLSTLNQHGRGFVHRLDKGTSGCVVLAKTNRMHAILIAHFFLRQVEKSYQALVVVQISNDNNWVLSDCGVIDLDIEGRPAVSRYRVKKSYGSLIKQIQVKTEQGRRHQVRLHCAEGLKTPILLDPLYGGLAVLSHLAPDKNDMNKEQKNMLIRQLSKHQSAQQFCLHADTLAIPAVGIHVRTPVPGWWQFLEDGFHLA